MAENELNLYYKTLQQMMVFFDASMFFFGLPVGILISYFMFYSRCWPLLVAYILWVYIIDRETPAHLGRKSRRLLGTPFVTYVVEYMSVKTTTTTKLDPKQNYLLCSHPHGIMGVGICMTFLDLRNFEKHFPGLEYYFGIMNWMFYIPFLREYYMAIGMCSVGKESLMRMLSQPRGGNIAVVAVGGAEEAFNAIPGESTVKLKNRFGFVKIALQTGSSIIPAYTFGENDLFKQVSSPPGSLLRKTQDFLKKYVKFAPIIPYGRFLCFPFRVDLTTVIGKPIPIPKMANPSEKDIQFYHQTYVDQLTKLFNGNKKIYSKYPNAILKIR